MSKKRKNIRFDYFIIGAVIILGLLPGILYAIQIKPLSREYSEMAVTWPNWSPMAEQGYFYYVLLVVLGMIIFLPLYFYEKGQKSIPKQGSTKDLIMGAIGFFWLSLMISAAIIISLATYGNI